MQNREPTYPGRVTLTPVAGLANTYDMDRADQPLQQGTPLTKATFLKDATAALFGLGTDAVPDDVLSEIGQYKQYWWRRRTFRHYTFAEAPTAENVEIGPSSSKSESKCTLSSNVVDNEVEGAITLAPPTTTVYIEYSTYDAGVAASRINAALPTNEYFIYKRNPGRVFKHAKAFTESDLLSSPTNGYWIAVAGSLIERTATLVPAGDWEYIHSSSRSAYPDSGTSGGYEYEYLGIPFDNAVTAPKIETGSYVGTGTYGQANPNTLTFGFAPKLVIIGGGNYQNTYGSTIAIMDSAFFMAIAGKSSSLSPDSSSYEVVSITGNSMSWYTTENKVDYQFNLSGSVYHYIAIG